jgi:hypothetical protein
MRLNLIALLSFTGLLILADPSYQPSSAPGEVIRLQKSTSSTEINLDDLLKKTADYCDKLESTALNFVCRENIEEVQNIPRGRTQRTTAYAYLPPADLVSQRKTWQYDYQLVRKGGLIDERRTLLQENGRAIHEENSSLRDIRFWHKNVIMGPIGLLGAAAQKQHKYRIAGEESIDRKLVIIVEATPQPDTTARLFGKAWVRKDDAAILKIEWQPESIGDYEAIVQIAKNLGAEPRLTFSSEYALEKNNIRFPSIYSVTEAYLMPITEAPVLPITGRLFTRSKTIVKYSDYKYFTVETDVKIR